MLNPDKDSSEGLIGLYIIQTERGETKQMKKIGGCNIFYSGVVKCCSYESF